MAVDLESMTVAELDAYAASLGLLEYPSSGSKSEKVAYLAPYADAVQVLPEAEEPEEEPEPETLTLELDPEYNGVQVQVGNDYVELTTESPSHETTDRPAYNQVKDVVGVKQADS